ncbi:peptidyl-lysine N-acetyltransferase PatZ-like [Condylostylus longicornis]|uniref:peptidyl-lysine N-acetyltransferase PatZ-like n=1 Tax=Condylostylus longicornis TaxID=2530218 RepID=UPI00244E18BD|nr:peptidyl-lysine N-acetyltransferase PatZ-like [Condylostylus longicornis]
MTQLTWDHSGATDSVELNPAQAYGDHSIGLAPLFQPNAIAVIGATDRDGAVGKTIVQNLIDSRKSRSYAIYPVNPTRKTICGLPAFPDVSACPTAVDLAVIVTPSKTVKGVVESCGKAKVPAVIVISAGFKELGEEGLQLENDVIAVARQYNIRLVGPNCLGIMAPHWGVNATFAATDALPGSIAFMSQSGAMCTAVLDWSLKERVGFSAFVSIGSMADINWGDLIDYLGNDPQTETILIYMETIGDAQHFLSAAKTVALHKPIIVIKAGQTEAAAQAAASHTGSLAGSHDAFLAAMKRAGVVVVDRIGELFDCALVLSKQPRPRGENLLIITNAGGPGVLATDATALSGATVCPLEKKTIEALNGFLPAAWSHSNPVDVLGDASAELYARTMEVALADKNADGVLVILSPQSVTDSTGTAKKVIEAYQRMRTAGTLTKPIMCSWMGGTEVSEGFNLLNANSIPTFPYPDAAARTFSKIWSHTKQLKAMCSPPTISVEPYCATTRKEKALAIMKEARDQGRDLLTEAESKQVLKAFGIPIAETVVCSTVEQAIECGKEMGFPCVVKLNSGTITHKSDVGGVRLNIKSTEEIRESWNIIKANVDKIGPDHFQGVSVQPMLKLEDGIELILGSIVDNQFGPLVLFGTGGCMVEIFKDSALGVPPLNSTHAQIQIEQTNIYKALKGGHGQRFPGVDVEALNKALCKFSQMVCDLSELMAECDINPLLALPNRLVALDARVVLRKPDQPVPSLAIRPYPQEYIFNKSVAGKNVTIRPTFASDAGAIVDFHKKLSSETVAHRYLREVCLEERISQQNIVSLSDSDYARLIALAVVDDATSEVLAIARIARWPSLLTTAELKVLVRDDVQKEGFGTALLQCVFEVAKQEKIKRLQCLVLKSNTGFLKLAGEFAMKLEPHRSNPELLQCLFDF